MLSCWIVRMTAVLSVIFPALSEAQFSLRNKQSCKLGCKDSHQSCLSKGRPLSWLMLAAGCGLLVLYNLIVTAVACYFGRKLKNAETETESDYYNTRPGEFKRVR